MGHPQLEAILHMYAQGYFPLGLRQGIGWFDQRAYGTLFRAVMPLDERFHIPKSLRRVLNAGRFEVRINHSFTRVLEGCATRGWTYKSETWLTPEVAELYQYLHRWGYAHSFETWLEGELAGGVLGVALGAAFIGDSMFYRVPNASKVALVRLVEYLRARGYELFDVQVMNPHLARFGAFEVDPVEFRRWMQRAIQRPLRFLDGPLAKPLG
ncbi:leucyl/phenylalanyl-tRNA--protein transferase [Meiothermus sp. QL-1]|uniref:leucyl/phenylalanyl-tRNA--protein transferase n=1 Tax=Meiothermus sp. QL-1 TaxID=2058095 RepID=UPI000E0C0D44|nr:leucyl/phenylalanyl-tRNA--protein transferase [Meiothermus sp. QL-1]RDI94878.1 leucyl/phenylalanyl-tRNA--protein transferase [Meiothermus sp. QL-1]